MVQAPTVAVPKRLPLVVIPANRYDDASKDAKLVNCYMEKMQDGDTWIYKRPGLVVDSRPPNANANGYGVFNWKGDIYSIFGDTMYKNGTGLTGTLDTSGGVYRFDSCLGATPKLQFGNGAKAYNYDSAGGIVNINDGDFPTSFVKGWAYLDSTTYVMRSSAAIQGSGINDPTSWDALNTITAQIEPDQGVALAKQLVYVIAFKQWSTEVFYDAANATGSPLGTVQGAKINWGCASQDSVQNMDGMLLWLATNRSGALYVMQMDQLKAVKVSTPPVDRLLNNFSTTTVFSWQYKHQGHRFYVLTSKTSNITLAYDLDEGMWSQWTDSSGNYLPIVSSTFTSSYTNVLQHETDGRLYTMSDSVYQDNGSVITVDVVTPNFDGNTRRRKLMNKMEFVADQVTGSSLLVRSSDDDYQTWTNFRQVDLGSPEPYLTECGTFKRRAHNFRHQSNTAFRLQAVELQMDIGTL